MKTKETLKRKNSSPNYLAAIYCFAALLLLSSCTSLSAGMSTVTVDGVGTVTAAPDTIHLSISLSRTAPTTREAREQVTAMAAKVLTILEESRIERRNTQTASLTFRPDYEWKNGEQRLAGQRAEQTIIFSMEGIDRDEQGLSTLLDRLTLVDGMEMQQMSYDIRDKSPLFSQSRELAFEKATVKAREYAALSGLVIDTVLEISENQSSFPGPMAANRFMAEAGGLGGSETADALPTGELEITTRITVVFRMKK